MIYLDSAATALYRPKEVNEAVLWALNNIGNPGRGGHGLSIKAAEIVYDTSVLLAKLFNINDPQRIAFCNNATEALNIAINSLIGKNDKVITTYREHNSVLRPLYLTGAEIIFAESYEDIENNINNTKAVIVNHSSNVTGDTIDVKRISQIAHKNNAVFILDASQTAGVLNIDVVNDGIDILCFTGHKSLMGPQGTGGIYVREGIELKPLKVGGSGILSFSKAHPKYMPEALEAGTLNCHGIAGLRASLKFILNTGIDNIYKKETELCDYFINNLKGVKLYGNLNSCNRTAAVALNIKDISSAEICDILWSDYGICTRGGAHCAPLMHKHLGTEEQGVVRFSFSYYNTLDEVKEAVNAVNSIAMEV